MVKVEDIEEHDIYLNCMLIQEVAVGACTGAQLAARMPTVCLVRSFQGELSAVVLQSFSNPPPPPPFFNVFFFLSFPSLLLYFGILYSLHKFSWP